ACRVLGLLALAVDDGVGDIAAAGLAIGPAQIGGRRHPIARPGRGILPCDRLVGRRVLQRGADAAAIARIHRAADIAAADPAALPTRLPVEVLKICDSAL